MANTPTTNIALEKPAAGDASWDVTLNANADTIDAQFAASGTAHSHNGTAGKGPKLAQSATHESPDTDLGASSLHHTLGTGAGQAAAGNHTHTGFAQTANNLSDLASAATARTNLGLGTAATHATGDYEPALGNPGTDGYVLSSTAAGVRSWAAPGTGGGGDPATATHAATSKATPVDADELPLVDSAASYALKKLTWANLKATLKSYFDGLYAAVTHTHAAADLTSGTIAPARLGSGTADATTYLRGDQTWATVSGGSGMTSPMTAKGDLIVGGPSAAVYTNQATVAQGATAYRSTVGGTTAPNIIDANDGTVDQWAQLAPVDYVVDLGQARTIDAFRALGTTSAAFYWTGYQIQSSPDNATWTAQYTGTTTQAAPDTGTISLATAVTARYWRLHITTAPGGSGVQVYTLAFLTFVSGTPAGTPARFAAGTNGTFPMYDSTATNGITAAVPLKVLASATVGTTQVTIAHGLGYTPTIVVPQMTSDGRVWRSAAPDATNIYLTADAAGRTCLPLVR